MKGARLRGSGGSLAQKLVGLGYQQVCGDPEVWGDGITPVPAAHLEGELVLRRPSVSPCDIKAAEVQVVMTSTSLIRRKQGRSCSVAAYPGLYRLPRCQIALSSLPGNRSPRCQWPLIVTMSLNACIAYGRPDHSDDTICAGAEQITLDGVYHSPLGGGTSRPWYGSPEIIDQWLRVVYDGKELDKDFQVEIGDMVAPQQ